jgi:hypothetical protein
MEIWEGNKLQKIESSCICVVRREHEEHKSKQQSQDSNPRCFNQ